jgi:hypothetical protein
MLPQPTFDNDYLRESLYEAVLNFLPNGLRATTQNILSQCVFGIVPSPCQVKTLLIIAPSLYLAEDLLSDIDHIKARVMYLMPDIGELGICVQPAVNNREKNSDNNSDHHASQLIQSGFPQYLMGEFFLLNQEKN